VPIWRHDNKFEPAKNGGRRAMQVKFDSGTPFAAILDLCHGSPVIVIAYVAEDESNRASIAPEGWQLSADAFTLNFPEHSLVNASRCGSNSNCGDMV